MTDIDEEMINDTSPDPGPSDDKLIPYQFRIRRSQIDALRKVATYQVEVSEHIRRAIDMYLSQPAIQAALVELEKGAERNNDGV